MENIEDNAADFQQKKYSLPDFKYSEMETLKLIDELKAHQIELEMQKEELVLAKEQAEIATLRPDAGWSPAESRAGQPHGILPAEIHPAGGP